MGRVRQSAEFETRYIPDPVSGCWIWQGCVNTNGYGYLTHCYKNYQAHRFSWIIHNGEIPPGMWVLHKCDTPLCVRPDHLFLGTAADNNADAMRKGRAKYEHLNGKGRKLLPGMQNRGAKLTDADVLWIRLDPRSQYAIAREYGIGQDQVSRIKTRQRWAHLP
jgi:hypothetical protein